jgi:hypothetical protein
MSAIALDDDIDRETTDSGIIPCGIRDRAMRAVLRHGPKAEDKERTRASKEYWTTLKRQRGNQKGVIAEVLSGKRST